MQCLYPGTHAVRPYLALPPDVVWEYYPTIIAGHIRMNVDRFDRTVPWCMMVPQSIFGMQPKIYIDGITT